MIINDLEGVLESCVINGGLYITHVWKRYNPI